MKLTLVKLALRMYPDPGMGRDLATERDADADLLACPAGSWMITLALQQA